MREIVTQEMVRRADAEVAAAQRQAIDADRRVKDGEANLLRLSLGELMQAHPAIARIGFKTESCYDDEGGTFLSVTLDAFDQNGVDLGFDAAIDDALMELDQELEVCERVFPGSDWRGGSLTRVQLFAQVTGRCDDAPDRIVDGEQMRMALAITPAGDESATERAAREYLIDAVDELLDAEGRTWDEPGLDATVAAQVAALSARLRQTIEHFMAYEFVLEPGD